MKSLLEIEKAIAKLPKESQRQLLRDMPAICPEVFPADGWEAILAETALRRSLTSYVDSLDVKYKARPEQFAALNEDSLSDPK